LDGLLALADQYAGRDLGSVNPAIYRIAESASYHAASRRREARQHNVRVRENAGGLPGGARLGSGHGLRDTDRLRTGSTGATATSRARPDVWIWSLSDDLLRVRHASRGSTGYAWGVEAQEVYPGATVIQGAKRAAYWADQLGIAFHEVLVEANSQIIGLIFSEATVAEVIPPRYVPFIAASGGHAETCAEG
jgi:hypothetical protein